MTVARGCLFVFEGLDRAGKTTQASLLASFLEKQSGREVHQIKFPDRTSLTGKLINAYLAEGKALDDHAIHLLFSANRWEKRDEMVQQLASGTHLIVDRYVYSGVAYSAAKRLPNLNRGWCASVDTGLLQPDAVFYLSIDPAVAAHRDDYGAERYEQLETQRQVAKEFSTLADENADHFHLVDGSQSVERVQEQVQKLALSAIERARDEAQPLMQLWGQPIS